MLLNIPAFKHTDILQMSNTDELIMGVRSAETVFQITSGSGASQCLFRAEQNLKERAIADDLYYDCYLREYPITYETAAGLVTNNVRMRDCYVIFMIDNLVRLRFTDNPDRGDCRSKQMDTLPVTVQGLPKDSLLVESWHDPDMCDGTDDCKCKEDVTMSPSTVQDALFQLSAAEMDIHRRFLQLCRWSVASIWKDVIGGLLIFIVMTTQLDINYT